MPSAAVVDSATEQAAKNVASTLVTRENVITNHKGNCTRVVCKNTQAAVNLTVEYFLPESFSPKR